MNEFLDFILLFLSQFSGGPSSPENNLVRFGLATFFWGFLLAFAWSRQRHERRPRERLLLYGFGLGFCRELLMVGHASFKILSPTTYQVACIVMEPIEHAMMLAIVVVISGAFLRYILDDALLARRFLQIGLAIAVAEYLVALVWWSSQLATDTDLRFHQSWSAWLMHFIACLVIIVTIVILVQKRGWLRNVILLALSLFLVSEFLVLLNLLLDSHYKSVLCPVANTFYIWAIPVFGYVYFRELSIEKREAEAALQAHRDHLEEIVAARTSELILANKQLKRAAVLEERQRIAAEMHDGLAQTLTYLLMKTDEASEFLHDGRSDQLAGVLSRIRTATDQASVDVRQAIARLADAPQPRQSLQDMLHDIVNEIQEENEKTIRLINRLDAPLFLIPAELEQVSRIIPEAILNAVRHAQAEDIWVQVEAKADQIEIIVADDGQGFNPNGSKVVNKNHFGLEIMHARAARLGGQLTIQSDPSQGTRVSLSWLPGNEPQGSIKRQKQLSNQKYQPVMWLPTM